MVEVRLIHASREGDRTIDLPGEKLSFGRGSDADMRFADSGLSRIHATVHRKGSDVWIVDENSSNGTFVNGTQVSNEDFPLRDGDVITIGSETRLTVEIVRPAAQTAKAAPAAATPAASPAKAAEAAGSPSGSILPVLLIARAFLVVTLSVAFIAAMVILPKTGEAARGDDVSVLSNDDTDDVEPKDNKKAGSDNRSDSTGPATPGETPTAGSEDLPVSGNDAGPVYTPPSGKKYAEMSDTEKRQYVADRSMKIAQVIGNSASDPIPPAAVDKIKAFVDAYAKRTAVKPLSGCRFGDNLQATYERARNNAPFIIHAFNAKGTDPRIGLYLAMIESEHCVCLQSPTGPLGMFQFTFATAQLHFENKEGIVRSASPSAPDERCKPEPAARAAASYMKALTGRYGSGPTSVPLAIGSYNSGEGGLSSNLVKALEADKSLSRDFWTMIANSDKLSTQFQHENFKYVPKFFAAAIIGENPQDFGLKLQPLSTYTK